MRQTVTTVSKGPSETLNRLLAFDTSVRDGLQGNPSLLTATHPMLVGIDEVGRGSLIGPVVAAAVIFPEKLSTEALEELHRLNDSKKLTPAIRKQLVTGIYNHGTVGVAEASQEEVERLNVHQASLLAAYRAYIAVTEQYRSVSGKAHDFFVLLDGRARMPMIARDCQQTVIKGDGLSAVIAAASVVAKEHRDAMIVALSKEYPQYGWHRNMGYAAKAHTNAIGEHGLTPYHRNWAAIRQWVKAK